MPCHPDSLTAPDAQTPPRAVNAADLANLIYHILHFIHGWRPVEGLGADHRRLRSNFTSIEISRPVGVTLDLSVDESVHQLRRNVMWERPLRNEVLQTGSTASPAIPRNGHSRRLQPRTLPPRIDWFPASLHRRDFLHAGKRRFQPFHVQPLS